MAQGITKVVEIVAGPLVQTLAKTAQGLLGPATLQVAELLPENAERLALTAADGPGDQVAASTWTYCESNFATQFGYFYKGMRSKPVGSTSGPAAAARDIVVWERHNTPNDVQRYLQELFGGSIEDANAIELADNLGSLFARRLATAALDWVPFGKRFAFPDGQNVDVYLVSAGATDDDGHRVALASFCFVAYPRR